MSVLAPSLLASHSGLLQELKGMRPWGKGEREGGGGGVELTFSPFFGAFPSCHDTSMQYSDHTSEHVALALPQNYTGHLPFIWMDVQPRTYSRPSLSWAIISFMLETLYICGDVDATCIGSLCQCVFLAAHGSSHFILQGYVMGGRLGLAYQMSYPLTELPDLENDACAPDFQVCPLEGPILLELVLR